MKHILLIAALCLLATGVSGCLKKKADITFNNHSDRLLTVHITGPGDGTGMIGTMEAGGTVGTTLVVPRGDMPVHFKWTAGPYADAIVVWKGTPSPLVIDVGKDDSTDDKPETDD